MYSAGVTNQNCLRGVQVTDANGQISFQTIFPVRQQVYAGATGDSASVANLAAASLVLGVAA